MSCSGRGRDGNRQVVKCYCFFLLVDTVCLLQLIPYREIVQEIRQQLMLSQTIHYWHCFYSRKFNWTMMIMINMWYLDVMSKLIGNG